MSTISLFSLIFRALLTMKFSSSSESESCTLFWGSGSDAGLLLVFLVGKVIATLSPVVLRPRRTDPQFTFWNEKKQNKNTKKNRFPWFCSVQITNKCPLCVHWVSNHGFHLPVDPALLQPVACIILLKHLWLLRCPPCVSGAVLLNRCRPQSQMVPTHSPTI